MKLEYIKCHGSGNDFIIIDEFNHDYQLTEAQRIQLTQTLCKRDKLIGADGILFVQKSRMADARMQILNADGSEAEMCGNGLRCVARYVAEFLEVEEAVIETKQALLKIKHVEPISEAVATYEVEIGPIALDVITLPMIYPQQHLIHAEIPELSDELMFTALSIPNPHIVTIVEEIDMEQARVIGEKANNLPEVFPRGTNVSFVKLIDKGEIFVQTYERGVGFTNSCGTAMSSSSFVTCLLDYNSFKEEIKVYNAGGMVKCNIIEGAELKVMLRGNATYTGSGQLDFDFETPSNSQVTQFTTNEQEINDYARFEAEVKRYLQMK